MVGFDGYVEKLLDQLTGYHSGRRILPIVGMGGIGKTTLARNVYQNSLTMEHFDVRAWVTVSQQYNPIEILSQALTCLGGSMSTPPKSADEVGEVLHKALSGRRYLIVLDDMWSVEAWEKIKFYFPENNNRSRIVVTTRQQQLVDYFASSSVAVDFLDDKNSWELFCEKIFGHRHEQGGCPPELEETGKKIVRRCKGLPLAISVIGGLLRKLPRTLQYWMKIAEDKNLYSSVDDEGKNPLSVLYTSYKYLPVCFKSCFLYLGLFPEDHQFDAPRLVKFLVAEGFIKSNRNQSLEEVAESCIKELVDRNLLLVGYLGRHKKAMSYRVHDLVRELMIRIAEKENFYCVQRDITGTHVFIIDERRASFYHQEQPLTSTLDSELPISIYRPLKFRGQNGAPSPCTSRLQRVMVDVGPLHALCDEVNLRLIYVSAAQSSICNRAPLGRLPSSTLPLFWSLQTIILRESNAVMDVPVEIWMMRQLRHIDILAMHLPDPCTATSEEDVIVLHSLQTLKSVHNLSWSEDICIRIPNVKEVWIRDYGLNHQDARANLCFHLHNLNKLESLRCCSYIEEPWKNLKLPNSLKELSLAICGLAWSDLEMIGALPHLQILDLNLDAVVGAEWNMGAEVE